MAIVNGTPGNDPTLVGTEENDTINAGGGNDGINALGGNDVINPGAGDDSVDAGSGDDTINASGGNDQIEGGAGSDVLAFASDLDVQDAAGTFSTTTTAFGSSLNDFSIRTYEINNVETLQFSNGTFDLTSSANQFFAEDLVINTTNRDGDSGTVGVQVASVDATLVGSEQVGTLNASAGTVAAVLAASFGFDAGDIRITAINGEAVSGAVVGAGGTVTINLETGGQVVVTGAGTYTYQPSAAVLNNSGVSTENFTVTFGNGVEGAGAVSFDQSVTGRDDADDNAFTAAAAGERLEGDADAETFTGGAGNDTLIGNGGDDTLTGGDGDDFASGGTGADTANLGAGNDQVFAGAGDTGNDTFNGDAGDDTLGGGAGNDTLDGGTGSDVLFGGSGDDVLTTGGTLASDVEQAFAGTGNDTLTGGAGNDILGGGAGGDEVNGGAGNDLIFGGAADLATDTDELNGGDGNDTIFGGVGIDVVNGGAGNDELFNGAGNDTVNGDAGNDTIFGGAGNDSLTGGTGNDTFVFEAGNGSDTIAALGTTATTDFDVIDLSGTTTDFTNLSDVVAAVIDPAAANAVIDLGGGDFLTLTGVSATQLAALDPSQFVF
jgi:Ca2+-binding RTX toxin-like protein